MRRMLCALALCFMWMGSATAQQLPPPFGLPGPDIPHPGTPESLRPCSPEYDKEIADQLAQLEQLRGVTSEQIMDVCDGVDTFEKGLETLAEVLGRDSEEFKKQLDSEIQAFGKPLGIPNLNIRLIKKMCVQQAGEVDRTIITEIGRLKSEQRRCAGI